MRGRNHLKLNKATMIEALENWLNKTQLSPAVEVKVTDVNQISENSSTVFSVEINSEDKGKTV